MPIYEYECKSCGHRFTLKQSFSDEPTSTCPHCQGQVRRLIFPTGVIFKGSGFYVTDNPRAKRFDPENGREKETPAPEKTEAKTEPKTETPVASGAGTDKKD